MSKWACRIPAFAAAILREMIPEIADRRLGRGPDEKFGMGQPSDSLNLF